MEAGPDELKHAVERQHGGTATLVESVAVSEPSPAGGAWEGIVHVFDLDNNPKASQAYAWSAAIAGSGERRFFAVLRVPPIDSPRAAVRAAITAEDEFNDESIAGDAPSPGA